jgi:hypothetical protein
VVGGRSARIATLHLPRLAVAEQFNTALTNLRAVIRLT